MIDLEPLRIDVGGIRLQVPPDWTKADQPDAVAAWRAPHTPGVFTPNVVLTQSLSQQPLPDVPALAFAELSKQLPGVQFIGCSPWPLNGRDGYHLTFTYPLERFGQVVVYQWIWALPHRHLQLTASFGPAHYAQLAPVMRWVAESVSFPDQPTTEILTPAPTGLSGLAPHQRLGLEGSAFTADALQVLANGSRSGRLLPADQSGPAFEQLISGALVSNRGRLTAQARALTGYWTTAGVGTMSIRRTDAHTLSSLDLWTGTEAALVAIPSEDNPAAAHLVEAPFDRVPALLAAWLKLAPHWPVGDDEPLSVSDAVYQQRLRNPQVSPPPAIGPVLARCWAEPWVEYQLLAPTLSLVVVRTGSGDWLFRDYVEDTLQTWPTELIFEALHQLLSATLND